MCGKFLGANVLSSSAMSEKTLITQRFVKTRNFVYEFWKSCQQHYFVMFSLVSLPESNHERLRDFRSRGRGILGDPGAVSGDGEKSRTLDSGPR